MSVFCPARVGLGLLLVCLTACAAPWAEPSVPVSPARYDQWERVRLAEQERPSFTASGLRGAAEDRNAAWLALAAALRHQAFAERLEQVNAFFNQWPYKKDQEVYGVEDYWATPAEFAARSGDCEDFAIAKYYALRFLGVPACRMRLAAVWNHARDEGHAVLLAYGNDGLPRVLDNFNDTVRPLASCRHYQPVWYVNEDAAWMLDR